ncbi:MAG: UDP-N-acetylmuramoyl-L-alanine--D-glutamate ligase [Actinobacteria bacterium]|nr:UDP-N-acetylmuramoyl-L-alanine--D-glutamate ligase [Actinomycetota bacterium]
MSDSQTTALPLGRCLVLGMGITGDAVAAALVRRGFAVVVVDDHPSPAQRARAESLGVELVEAPTVDRLRHLVEASTALFPSPGIPEHHALFAASSSAGVPILSEFDLARAWDDRPVLAVTGTNGKTTVTTMVTDMVNAGGRRGVMAGNTELPLVSAIDDPTADVFVVEASSFRLGHTQRFEPGVATWLNFADDHLDVHASLQTYERAKARIWDHLPEFGLAIANADDPVVMRNVVPANRTTSFSVRKPVGYHVAAGLLVTDEGVALVPVDDLPRKLPHDVANALAGAATAIAGGVPVDVVRSVLRRFNQLPHRVQLVAESGGVRWYDDSKATAPHATESALRGFDSVVLIAGGRNKGLDLSPMGRELDRIRAVIAIGDAAGEVHDVFAPRRPVVVAASMPEAVEAAEQLARPGDAVLLSPGCASFDWYDSYAQRGDAFAAAVRDLLEVGRP